MSSDMKMEYCGLPGGHTGHPNADGTMCGGYPPSQADAGQIAAALMVPEQVSEWWFTLRHETPELNCPVTGKTWALQGSVMGGLVALPPIMMCTSCGAALVLVDNGPTAPEEVKTVGAGPSDVV